MAKKRNRKLSGVLTSKARSALTGKYIRRTPLRAPRTGILHGDDPTLAKRVEEELHDFGR